jgi:hypothetical protein
MYLSLIGETEQNRLEQSSASHTAAQKRILVLYYYNGSENRTV